MEQNVFNNYCGQKIDLGFVNTEIIFSEEDEKELKSNPKNLDFKCGSGSMLRIEEELGSGGQGTVYTCSHKGFVVKLYKKQFRLESTFRKIQLLVNNNPGSKRLCWPVDIVYYKGKFVGFLMPFVSGKECVYLTTGNMPKVVMRNKKYTKEKQIDMLLQILKEIDLLHSKNILLGDINTRNIIYDNEGDMDITIVDIDSVQIGQFPCVTSTPGYDAPEIVMYRAIKNGKVDENIAKEKDKRGNYLFNNYYHNYYRTLKNEYHAIAVLLFEIMTCGCKPYECQEFGINSDDANDEDIKLCINYEFPYSSIMEKTNNECTRKAIWSHMPSFIKDAFVKTFTGKRRLSPSDWIALFEHYKKLLNDGVISDKDKEAYLSFPENEINYKDLMFLAKIEHFDKGFVMSHVVDRVMKLFKDDDLNKYRSEVAKALSHQQSYSIGKYNFTLVYNIGILKKVKAVADL